ncbi:MAG TPA: MotA/TolQ/ExbB proton channel family protein [Deltaproteobacteria bacterium]|nr:MotA/TolQ/ExbB proton channel family protein [Deltaproteobacteria bacterium]HPJ93290.1 MotA/TolQ/ExbB proton channel family protein [Deltaproteobacteria bacterium]HPR51591.1 MotA/TolQ/ExbB proton channel family protein [Deltaproteobacteria bacterium]
MKEMFIRGGPLMWPLLICSIVSVTITIERVIFWWREHRLRRGDLIEDIFWKTQDGHVDSLLEEGQKHTGEASGRDFALRVLLCGLAHRDCGLRETMEVAATKEIDRMKRGLDILDTIITMAPLLGILGTVLGIIDSFDLLGAGGIENPRAVTGGIAQALITTAAGLTVALVTLVPFNYFVERVRKATNEINNLMVRLETSCRKGTEVKSDGNVRI